MKRLMTLAAVLPLLTTTVGCFPFLLEDDDDDPPPRVSDPPPAPRTNEAPRIDVDIPSWPPLGSDSVLTIEVSDDAGLDTVDLRFRNAVDVFVSGVEDTVEVRADALGEGLGTLAISATDFEGRRTEERFSDLLIDLSPPEITLGETVVRHATDSDIALWVADAWVLGRVELTVGDVTLSHDFEPHYPSTLGQSWHYAQVTFPSISFSEGTDSALVTLYDAAGNTTESAFQLTLDGQVPLVVISSPAPSTVVSGLFDVVVDAEDESSGPVFIELRVDGTPVATALGPSATMVVDAAALTPGDVELQAVATDEAGNTSTLATVPIVVE